MRDYTAVWESIKNVFLNFQWIIIVEAVFLVAIIYFVLKTLYENNAKKLIFIYVFFLLCTGTMSLFTANETVAVLSFYMCFSLVSLFFLLLFNLEIKRSVWNKAHRAMTASSVSATKMPALSARADEYVTGIVKAVQNLSKGNIGALIVLSNGNLPKTIVESGVTLNAAISSQLIEGIFIPKAPLHDGAMIIYGDKIQAAGCFLPLTQRDFPKDYGTRHRAGIGVTEVADVSTIIVSEETGIVSVVKRGEISRFVDSEGLKRFLKEYYWKELNTEGKAK